MAYSDFTLREALDRFQLTLVDDPDLFARTPEVEPGQLLKGLLPEFLPLALAINTEKARSELVIAPLLAALRAQMNHRFSVFSGIDFNVDPAKGSTGSATSSCPAPPNSSSCAAPSRPSQRPRTRTSSRASGSASPPWSGPGCSTLRGPE